MVTLGQGGPASNDSVLRRTEEETQRRSHVETEAEMGGMQSPAQGSLGPPELKEARRPLPGSRGESSAWDTWTSDAWSPGRGWG